MNKRQLIIIPGLGDRGNVYKLIAPLWSALGYNVHIFVFGWEDSRLDFKHAMQRLDKYIDDIGECSIIGVSAGGTAAVHALLNHPGVVKRIITVCSPYNPAPHHPNPRLRASLDRLKTTLPSVPSNVLARVVSVHALYDGVVAVANSKPHDIRQVRLLSVGHAFTIGVALTVGSVLLKHFLHDR